MPGTYISRVPSGSPDSNLTQGQIWGETGKESTVPSMKSFWPWGCRMVGSLGQLFWEDAERSGAAVHLQLPEQQGSIGYSSAGIAVFPASVWRRRRLNPAGTHFRASQKDLQRPYVLQIGQQIQRDGRDSLVPISRL